MNPRFDGFLTDLRFCCATNVWTAGAARDPDVYRECSNRLLVRRPTRICLAFGALPSGAGY